jgi:drug/metabolite transporter (DMT)-like permease
MSLVVAVPCALAAALAYGAATAVEHASARAGAGDAADGRALLALLRDPRWLLGMGGDVVGLVLQVIALATGPVSLVQPLLVLALPISLPIAWRLGGPRPGRSAAVGCALIVVGLGVFFVLVGDPGVGDGISTRMTVFLFAGFTVAGGLALLAVRGRSPLLVAAGYGTVAGAWFGFVAVLMDAITTGWQAHGLHLLATTHGWALVVAAAVLGAASVTLTQAAFQVGALSASFPGNLAADPVVAVLLGGVVLHENVPASALHLVLYAACLAAIVLGAIRLAADSSRPA